MQKSKTMCAIIKHFKNIRFVKRECTRNVYYYFVLLVLFW